MQLSIDSQAGSPIYRQIQDQIRYAISVGDLRPGDALPSIRQLETELGVNRNTVRRAYLELQAEGTLVLRQGREARVSEQVARSDSFERSEAAGALAKRFLQLAESRSIDGLQLAQLFEEVAREHDATYPKCVVLECSSRQAQDFAHKLERILDRRVVGLDLHALREDASLLPASTRYVLTPHWHMAEAREVVGARAASFFDLGVQLAAECIARLKRLKGTAVALVVRDAESVPGYRELLNKHLGRRKIPVVLVGAADVGALSEIDHVVHTAPCADFVRTNVPSGIATLELEFEPKAEALDSVRLEIFPSLTEGAGVV